MDNPPPKEDIIKMQEDHKSLREDIPKVIFLWSAVDMMFSSLLANFLRDDPNHYASEAIISAIVSFDTQVSILNTLVSTVVHDSPETIIDFISEEKEGAGGLQVKTSRFSLWKEWESIIRNLKSKKEIRNTVAHGTIVSIGGQGRAFVRLRTSITSPKNRERHHRPPYGLTASDLRHYVGQLDKDLARLRLFVEIIPFMFHKAGPRPPEQREEFEKNLRALRDVAPAQNHSLEETQSPKGKKRPRR